MYNLPAAPTQEEQDIENFGPVEMEWTYPEFNKHQRGAWWYVAFIGVSGAILTYSILNGNFLLAIVIILFGFIMLNYHRHEPNEVPFQIRAKGIRIGSKFILYTSLQNFWIVYEPPQIKTLYFMRKERLHTEVSIPLIEANPIQIRDFLGTLISEDLSKETETSNDSLGRILKIH